MATIYHTSSNDGWCASSLGVYASARNDPGNLFDSNNSADDSAIWHVHYARRGTYGIRRAFFEFDTSGISAAPSAATLKIYGYVNTDGNIIAVKSEQGGTLAAGDFNSFASTVTDAFALSDGSGAGSLALISTDYTYSAAISWSSGYNNLVLTAPALSDMASLDTFKVCLMNYDHDYLDSDETTEEKNGLNWSERTGTGSDPYIDYTPALVAENATFFGANF